jgi:hypothetical protein
VYRTRQQLVEEGFGAGFDEIDAQFASLDREPADLTVCAPFLSLGRGSRHSHHQRIPATL